MSRKSQPARAGSPNTQPKVEVRLPELHPRQQEIFEDRSRFKVVVCGRQFGKTSLGVVMCMASAIRGGDVWWVAPSFPLAEQGWRVIEQMAAAIPGTRTEGRPIFRATLATGGTIQAKSADNPDSLRGATLDGLVIDEAATAKDGTWPTLLPTLTIRKGWAMLISTPKGLNWFFDVFEGASKLNGWNRWQIPSLGSPFIDETEVARSRESMSPLMFSQEYLAEFVSAASGVFHADWFVHYQEHTEGPERIYVLGGEPYLLSDCTTFHTVDLAWSTAEQADYTVIMSWALTRTRQLILLDMIRGRFEPPDILPHLRRAYERYGGVMVIEHQPQRPELMVEAQRTGIPVKEVRPSKNKVARADLAAARMASHNIWFPPASTSWYRDLENEMLAFPVGRHDDMVDAVAYAAIHGAGRSVYEDRGIISI